MAKKICRILDEIKPLKNFKYENLITFVKDRPGHDLRYAIDTSKISSELNWSPRVNFTDGLRDTIFWYLNNKSWWEEIQKSKTIPATRSDSIEYVIVDEGQFFQNLYLFCLICLEKFNVNVIVTGLDGDYERKPMGEILDLLPIANNITKLSARCNICNAEAIFTPRTSTEKEQVLIGGSDKYVPLCRYHYVLENNLISNSLEFS